MKSIILCEGSTDYALLQYFMRKVYDWQDAKTNEQASSRHFNRIRTMRKGTDVLSIAGCGGSSRILPGLDFILEQNSISNNQESYHKIVILTDRDEVETEQEFADKITRMLSERDVKIEENVSNDKWIKCTYRNGQKKECYLDLLMLVVPFEETGAMETFLYCACNFLIVTNNHDLKGGRLI